ncbi:hypothetical protein BJ170DRAFT_641059 [Xylariales sp. AK1849]|nr:hypothetical protein BJ170DRAFT_641059 [Xylariales sp. AK1849]
MWPMIGRCDLRFLAPVLASLSCIEHGLFRRFLPFIFFFLLLFLRRRPAPVLTSFGSFHHSIFNVVLILPLAVTLIRHGEVVKRVGIDWSRGARRELSGVSQCKNRWLSSSRGI